MNRNKSKEKVDLICFVLFLLFSGCAAVYLVAITDDSVTVVNVLSLEVVWKKIGKFILILMWGICILMWIISRNYLFICFCSKW